MTTRELIRSVADLVSERRTIDHGSIRCLWSEAAVNSIFSVEDCDEVDEGTIGDDALASDLLDLSQNGDRMSEIDLDRLWDLSLAHLGSSEYDYLDRNAEDELKRLDHLIEVASKLL